MKLQTSFNIQMDAHDRILVTRHDHETRTTLTIHGSCYRDGLGSWSLQIDEPKTHHAEALARASQLVYAILAAEKSVAAELVPGDHAEEVRA